MRVRAGMRSRVAQAGRQAGRHHQQSTGNDDDDDRDELQHLFLLVAVKYCEHD